jgi:hypothetical protein
LAAVIREGRFIFARQASHPPLELPIESGGAIKSATTINLSQRVVSFVKKAQAFFYAIASEQIVKGRIGEATQQQVQMILANAAVPGCIAQTDVGICVGILYEGP